MSTEAPAGSLIDAPWSSDPEDPAFGEPFVDVDEWRDAPVRHRYVHGGFRDGDTRFSMYLPEPGRYEGRFFQHVTPVPQSEHLAPLVQGEESPILFAVESGGCFLETNGGGPRAASPFSGLDPSIGAYRANAAAARLARQIAARVYGEHRAFGYLYGGSGGGFRTIGAAENTDGVWDGFVPYVIGSPMAMPNVFTVRMHAQRVLRDRLADIVDAYDVGGDPAELELTEEQRAAFDEVTAMGFPPRSWFGWKTMGMHGFSALYPGVMAADPSYATDFWTADGYLGADPEAEIHRDRVVHETTVVEVVQGEADRLRSAGGVDDAFRSLGEDAPIRGARLADAPDGWILGAELRVRSGAASGGVLRVSAVEDDLALFEDGQDADLLALLRPGDEVVLDNSSFLAMQTYHRHQVPPSGYPVWDRFRAEDGAPLLPQRPLLLGPRITAAASGTVPTGRIRGRMIVVASLLDREAFPWQADWYRQQVAEQLGDEAERRFRLWYMDNALHGDDRGTQEPDTRSVSYVGALQAALRQVAAWVERGVEPAPSTAYSVVDGQVAVAPDDPERGGVQPLVSVTVDGDVSTVTSVDTPVAVRIAATAVQGAIVQVATDLVGSGAFEDPFDVAPDREVVVERICRFSAPGTYFISAQATAQVDGDPEIPVARVHNLARARVTVV